MATPRTGGLEENSCCICPMKIGNITSGGSRAACCHCSGGEMLPPLKAEVSEEVILNKNKQI